MANDEGIASSANLNITMNKVSNGNPVILDTHNEITETENIGSSTIPSGYTETNPIKNKTTSNTSKPTQTLKCTKSNVVVAEEVPTTEGKINHNQSSSECCKNKNSGVQEDKKIDPCLSELQTQFLIRGDTGVETVRENTLDKNASEIFENKNANSGPVPNFRIEGSGTGDSSITVAVTSLVNAVTLSNSSSCISGCDNTTGDHNSGSGPVSMQSSEDMKLSLVSWYSEPDDQSRIAGDSSTSCCGRIIAGPLHLQNGRETMSGSLPNCKRTEEKENKTPELMNPSSSQNLSNYKDTPLNLDKSISTINYNNSNTQPDIPSKCNSKSCKSSRTKMHVQVVEQIATSKNQHGCYQKQEATRNFETKNKRPECPRCSRKSKSGSATPAIGLHEQSRSRTPLNRRLIQSSKSSTELKKPIKSILKSDSRGSPGGSGSGSDNKSSMDSLGSTEIGVTQLRQHNSLMTRSDSGTRAKFNLNHQIYNDTPRYSAEDRIVSKLKRIEKYATLRLRKTTKVKPIDLNDSDVHTKDQAKVIGTPGGLNDLMTKSMSFLEKASIHGECRSVSQGTSTSANSTLKRQGSLRIKKSPSAWEPCTTRTTALRIQKMQEAKAKSGQGYVTGSAYSGSTHSGSGDSIHHLLHSTTTVINHHCGTQSTFTSKSYSSTVKEKVQHVGVKAFSKLSSAMGQTASSNQKRLKQDKAIQTELLIPQFASHSLTGDLFTRASLSPVPSADAATDITDQIKKLETLSNRYRNTALRFQAEFEKSEAKNMELTKQLQETQTESNEMIEFLQTEKSTLADSLIEIENESKTWRTQLENESESRCSSLVRLSEQQKQESLKSKALMNRLEAQCNSTISQLSSQLIEGKNHTHLTKQKVDWLADSLLKTYKVPHELLVSPADLNYKSGLDLAETGLSSSLLLPLIKALAAAFCVNDIENYSKQKSYTVVTSSVPAIPLTKLAIIPNNETVTESKFNSSGISVSISLPKLHKSLKLTLTAWSDNRVTESPGSEQGTSQEIPTHFDF